MKNKKDINDLSILESKRIIKFLSKHFDLSKLTCDLKIEDINFTINMYAER